MTAFAAGTRWPRPLGANPYGLPIGLQLYTVREQLPKDLPGTLRKVAEIGYREVEVYGIQFCYHNHNFEFTQFGDTTAYDFLLKELDAKLVQFEMDCATIPGRTGTPKIGDD